MKNPRNDSSGRRMKGYRFALFAGSLSYWLIVAGGQFDDSHLVGATGQLDSAASVELFHKVGSVRFDGLYADFEHFGDLLGAVSLCDGLQHFAFAVGKPAFLATGAGACDVRFAEQTRCDGTQVATAIADFPHAFLQFRSRGALGDDAMATEFEQFANGVGCEIRRNRYEARLRMLMAVLSQYFHAIEARKKQVENDKVGFLAIAELHALASIGGFADDVHAWQGTCHARDEIPQHDLVFDYYDTCWRSAHLSS